MHPIGTNGEERLMKSRMTSLDELWRMKEEMDRMWSDLFQENLGRKEEDTWQWVDKLPKFEGAGRRSLRVRSNKIVRSS